MSQRPFMPFYSGDWERDTAHLDDHQERAYFRLVNFYWAQGGLPKDDRALARICRMTPYVFKKNRHIISDFFESDWTHKRIEIELQKYQKFVEKQRGNGAKPKAKSKPDRSQTETRARVLPQPIYSADAESKPFHFFKSQAPQYEAWRDFNEKSGRKTPIDKDGGWRFPSEWPPGDPRAAVVQPE